jgi:four helix bundle protein
MFDFENLDVYQLSISFCERVMSLLKTFPPNEICLADQCKRAAFSIPLNLAEGCGRIGNRERRNFFNISRGSAFECVPILTLMKKGALITDNLNESLRSDLVRIIQMLTKLIQKFDII